MHISCACFGVVFFSAVTEAGKVGDDLSKNFFKEEYILNYKIGELVFLLYTGINHFHSISYQKFL